MYNSRLGRYKTCERIPIGSVEQFPTASGAVSDRYCGSGCAWILLGTALQTFMLGWFPAASAAQFVLGRFPTAKKRPGGLQALISCPPGPLGEHSWLHLYVVSILVSLSFNVMFSLLSLACSRTLFVLGCFDT